MNLQSEYENSSSQDNLARSSSKEDLAGSPWWKKKLAIFTAMTMGAVAIVIAFSSGSLALWNTAADIENATIVVGELSSELSIGLGSAAGPKGQTQVNISTGTWSRMLPGQVIGTGITVTNQGTAASSLSAVMVYPGDASSPYVSFHLSSGSCTEGVETGQLLGTTPVVLDSQKLAGGASGQYCLQATLDPSIPNSLQGQNIVPAFDLSITGTQVNNNG